MYRAFFNGHLCEIMDFKKRMTTSSYAFFVLHKKNGGMKMLRVSVFKRERMTEEESAGGG